MCRLVIVGNSLSAEIMYKYLMQDKRYKVVAFAVNREYIDTNEMFGLPVCELETLPSRFPATEVNLVMGVGYNNLNRTRESLYACGKEMGYEIETYIHPDAKVYNDGNIGEGSIIFANTVVEVCSTIGKNSVIWANCIVAHHAGIGDNCWIASGTVVAGQAKIGNNSFLGVNVSISNQVELAEFNIIGGHTAIHKKTKKHEVYLSAQGEKHRFTATDYANYYLR